MSEADDAFGSNRSDVVTRKRLDDIQAGYLQWSRWTLWILIGIIVVQIGLGVVAVYLNGQIKAQLHRSLVIECLDRNSRHDATIVKLTTLINESKDIPPSARKSVREQNILLINVLIPKFPDCGARANRLEGD